MNCFVIEQDNAGLQKTGREDEQGGGQEKREYSSRVLSRFINVHIWSRSTKSSVFI